MLIFAFADWRLHVKVENSHAVKKALFVSIPLSLKSGKLK